MIDIKERLRAFDSFAVNPKICKEAADHIEQLEAEIARLRKDAERLDFILDENCAIQEFSAHDLPVYNLNWHEVGEQQSLVYKTPRDAVDAAMLANISTQEV